MPCGYVPESGKSWTLIGLNVAKNQIPCRIKLTVSWDKEFWMPLPGCTGIADIDAVAYIGEIPHGSARPEEFTYDGPAFALPPGMYWRVDVIGDIDDE